MKYKITSIQLFDNAYPRQTDEDEGFEMVYSYSAKLIINDSFVVRVSGCRASCAFDGITDAATAFWSSEQAQDDAFNNIDSIELEEALETDGFENNIGWLADNADEVFNPENAQYRFDNSDTQD